MEIIIFSVIIGVFSHPPGTDLPRALSVSGSDTGERHPVLLVMLDLPRSFVHSRLCTPISLSVFQHLLSLLKAVIVVTV